MDLNVFINRYPRIYHMAEEDTWESIQQYGLLSTSAILDIHSIKGMARDPYEKKHRPTMTGIVSGNASKMVLRDQKPMAPQRLAMGLRNGIATDDWYAFLNRKVFFWATEDRLLTLLGAKDYRKKNHDVMTIDTASFVSEYEEKIMLCHMNSGNTFPIPHMRDYSVFMPIVNYPTKKNNLPLKEVAEVTVEYHVPNLKNHVIQVQKMQGPVVLNTVYKAKK